MSQAKPVRALFVGGPLHGIERDIPMGSYLAVESRGAPLTDPDWMAHQVTYTPRRVIRELGDGTKIQMVWVDNRLHNWVPHVSEAVVLAWFRSGAWVTPEGKPV